MSSIMKKYTLDSADSKTVNIDNESVKVYRIVSARSIGKIVKDKGIKGGYIQSETNLSQDGMSWIDETSVAAGESQVLDSAQLKSKSLVTGNVLITGHSTVTKSTITNNAKIQNNCKIKNSKISDNVIIKGEVDVDNSEIKDDVIIQGKVKISKSKINDGIVLRDLVKVSNSNLDGHIIFIGKSNIKNTTAKNITDEDKTQIIKLKDR